jgi:hypothetical protein
MCGQWLGLQSHDDPMDVERLVTTFDNQITPFSRIEEAGMGIS